MVSRETPSLPDWLDPVRDELTDYAQLLATTAVTRGLIGPREVPRLWDRHLLNCAVVAEPSAALVPLDAVCADVGSGAGLPGLVWAIARPDLRVVLIEPLLRRSTFLAEAVEQLGLGARVQVVRDRAEQVRPDDGFDVVTARAVAPLDRLIGWTAPLLRRGGRLVALKGQTAVDEVTAAGPTAAAAGLVGLAVLTVGDGIVDPPTTVIVGTRGTAQ